MDSFSVLLNLAGKEGVMEEGVISFNVPKEA